MLQAHKISFKNRCDSDNVSHIVALIFGKHTIYCIERTGDSTKCTKPKEIIVSATALLLLLLLLYRY